MYLVDTDVLFEARKRSKANRGVREFIRKAIETRDPLFVSVITVGELRNGIGRIRSRGEAKAAVMLERWLQNILDEYPENVLGIDADTAQLWGTIRLPVHFGVLDRQIAATARIHDLTLVTRRARAYAGCGIPALDPFSSGLAAGNGV